MKANRGSIVLSKVRRTDNKAGALSQVLWNKKKREEKIKAKKQKAMDELVAQAQELKMY